jgi:hypothetical protein
MCLLVCRFPEAFRKAMQSMKESKYTPLEKRLGELGCVKWDELEITPAILEIVEKFHRPEKGSFILQPGLSILYLNDIN